MFTSSYKIHHYTHLANFNCIFNIFAIRWIIIFLPLYSCDWHWDSQPTNQPTSSKHCAGLSAEFNNKQQSSSSSRNYKLYVFNPKITGRQLLSRKRTLCDALFAFHLTATAYSSSSSYSFYTAMIIICLTRPTDNIISTFYSSKRSSTSAATAVICTSNMYLGH